MDNKELEENLGTIAKSGSFDFKKDLDDKNEADGFVSLIKSLGLKVKNGNGPSNEVKPTPELIASKLL